jgi:energy-coupling factor transport system substrate-specific component
VSWVAASAVILGLVLAAGFAWYERSHPTSRMLALVATLAALAALGRVAFAPLPNVKPTTDIVLFAGYVLGGAPGFAVGAVGGLASNLFFGQGPWTPWQMAGWGLVGLGGAALGTVVRDPGRVTLAVAGAVAGVVYGAVMNVFLWVTFSGDHTLAKLGAIFATSLPFDAAHVLGNVAFALAFGPAFVASLQRFRTRTQVRWLPIGAAAPLAIALALALPMAAGAAVPKQPVRYLLGAQNADGGFAGAPGQRSTGLHTGWTALGLAAAGRNPLDVRSGGHSVIDYMTAHAGELSDLGEIERTILVLRAAGHDPRRFAGRDLVAELVRKQRPSGAFADRVNTTAFAVLALRAAGRSRSNRTIRRATAWLARQANPDGGFNFAGRGGGSGIDDTSAAVQGLVGGGRRRSTTVRRAARFLVRAQNADGGFPLQRNAPSNAQSTAWAVQGLVAAGRDPAKVRTSRTPLGYLRSLTAASGAIRYSRTSTQTPVWVTGQALTAFALKPFPLRPVARAATATKPVSTPIPTPTATPRPKARPARRPPAVEPISPLLAVQAWRAGALLALLL